MTTKETIIEVVESIVALVLGMGCMFLIMFL